MNKRNRLAISPWGKAFTDKGQWDYEGYMVPAGLAVLDLIIGLPVFGVLGLWWWLIGVTTFIVLYALTGLWLTTAPVNSKKDSTIEALIRYRSLDKDDRRMFPANTEDTLLKYDSPAANDKVTKLFDEINAAKQNATLPILEDFMGQLEISTGVLKDQKELR